LLLLKYKNSNSVSCAPFTDFTKTKIIPQMDSAETREEYVCSNKLLLRMESWEEQCAEVINNKKQCKLNGKEPRDAEMLWN
jgi:hypothetical protein